MPEVYADIEIYSAKVLDESEMKFEISCSSGTYIRSICRDIALKTGNVGTMTALQRIEAGGFTIEQAEELDAPEHTLYPLESAFKHMEHVEYEPFADILNGRKIECDAKQDRIAMMHEGKIAAVYERDHDNVFRSKRGLW